MFKYFLHDVQNDVWKSSDVEVGWRGSLNLAVQYDTEQDALDDLAAVTDGGYYEVIRIYVK